MKRTITYLIVAVTLFSLAVAQDKVGTNAANFLNIPIGAKAIGMGGAYTAMADDPSALYWNPGAMSRTGKSDVYTSYTDYFLDVTHTWFGGQYMLSPSDALGISINSVNYGDWEKVTTVEDPEGTGEYWQASDLCLGVSYSRSMTDKFSIGGTLKYISEKIYNESASTIAMDLGLLFITDFNGLQIGASIRNFGGDMQLSGRDLLTRVDLDESSEGNNENIVSYLKTDAWPIPLTYVIGVAYPLIDRGETRVMLAADFVRPTNDSQTANVGVDMTIADIVSLRGGYQSLFKEDSEGGLTFGIGLDIVNISGYALVFDYAFQQFGKLGNYSTTSISLKF